ncbi:MAG: L,D-transpeptidase family protein [Thiohalocapsa sp.]
MSAVPALLIAVSALTATAAAAEFPASGTAAVTPVAVQPDAAAAGDNEIRSRLDSVPAPTIGGEKLHVALLQQFYAAHNFQPVWSSHPAQATSLLAAVMRSGEHGLDPELFHATLLRNRDALPPLNRELLLSDAFLAYADALARGVMPLEHRLDDEDLRPEPISIPAALDNAIASPNPAAAIEALAPQSPEYRALRQALQRYRPSGNADGDAVTDRHAGRQDRSADSATTGLRKIEINLERQRWLPRHLPADRIWVNLPTEQLVLYRNNQPVFTTRVIIGQSDWQTPEMQTEVKGVVFNPPWNVPPSIASEEILPKLRRDPNYLAHHHMVWRSSGGLQQLPGHGTALGRLKLDMPNRFDVYLHDTPLKGLFSRDNRRQSHGCVRVQEPRELAALLLQQPVEAINKAIAPGGTTRRGLPTPMPVFFVYQTAFLDANGAIEFRPDVYDRDQEVWRQLHPARHAPVAEGKALRERNG